MSETDEQRAERLTDLARRVFKPDARLIVRQASISVADDFGGIGGNTGSEQLYVHGPRAMDAIEAALCALTREPPRWAVALAEEWIAGAPAGTMSAQFAEDRADELLEAAKGAP